MRSSDLEAALVFHAQMRRRAKTHSNVFFKRRLPAGPCLPMRETVCVDRFISVSSVFELERESPQLFKYNVLLLFLIEAHRSEQTGTRGERDDLICRAAPAFVLLVLQHPRCFCALTSNMPSIIQQRRCFIIVKQVVHAAVKLSRLG